MTAVEFREWVLEHMAQYIAAGELIEAYDQMGQYIHDIEGSRSKEELACRLRARG